MTSWTEILKANKGLHARDSFSELWGLKLKAARAEFPDYTITGTLPLTFNSRAAVALKNYRIYGTSAGAGEETENLWDGVELFEKTDLVTDSIWSWDSLNVGGVFRVPCEGSTQYTIKVYADIAGFFRLSTREDSLSPSREVPKRPDVDIIKTSNISRYTFTTSADAQFILFQVPSIYIDIINQSTCLVKGSTAPATFIPYGYKIPILCQSGIVSENEFPYAEAGTFALGTGSVVSDGKGSFSIDVSNLLDNTYSDYIPLKQNYTIPQSKDTGGEYTFYLGNSSATIGLFIEFLDSNKIHIEEWQCATSWRKSTAYSNMTGSTIAYIRFYVKADFIIQMTMSPMFSKNSNLTSYVPHFQQSNYDLFIGDSKLGEEEYVDYAEQKIYKDVSGTLTPTDPPAPLPAIQTYQGENTLSSTETLGEVSVKGRISEVQNG